MIIRVAIPDDHEDMARDLAEWLTSHDHARWDLIGVWHDTEPDPSGRTARWSTRVTSIEIT